MPKGVMWRQDDLFVRLNGAGLLRFPEDATRADVAELVRTQGHHPSLLLACPLMHGTGLFTSLRTLVEGGRVVLLTQRSYDSLEFAYTLDERSVRSVVIVGDSFALPRALRLRFVEGDCEFGRDVVPGGERGPHRGDSSRGPGRRVRLL